MRVFVTGANGQLGHDVVNEAVFRGYDVIASGTTLYYSGIDDGSAVTISPYVYLDITVEEDVYDVFDQIQPDVIVHCAAYTNVQKAETDYEAAYNVNIAGTKYISKWCQSNNIKMVYISSDYVFNGNGNKPWRINDIIDPVNNYGITKRQGEWESKSCEKHFIIRTSWLYGLNGNNFVKTMINLSNKEEVRVVCDQIGRPTYAADLAILICDMIETDKYGIYHASNTGDFISWAGFAKEIFKLIHSNTKVYLINSDEYELSVIRPLNSRLDTSLLTRRGFKQLPDWHNALCRYIKELKGVKLL